VLPLGLPDPAALREVVEDAAERRPRDAGHLLQLVAVERPAGQRVEHGDAVRRPGEELDLLERPSFSVTVYHGGLYRP